MQWIANSDFVLAEFMAMSPPMCCHKVQGGHISINLAKNSDRYNLPLMQQRGCDRQASMQDLLRARQQRHTFLPAYDLANRSSAAAA